MEMVARGLETRISVCPKNIDLSNLQLIQLDLYPYILEPGDYLKAQESVSWNSSSFLPTNTSLS